MLTRGSLEVLFLTVQRWVKDTGPVIGRKAWQLCDWSAAPLCRGAGLAVGLGDSGEGVCGQRLLQTPPHPTDHLLLLPDVLVCDAEASTWRLVGVDPDAGVFLGAGALSADGGGAYVERRGDGPEQTVLRGVRSNTVKLLGQLHGSERLLCDVR